MTMPSVCRACLRDQHHRCVGWCGCPLAHSTISAPAPKVTKPTAPRTQTTRPTRARRVKTVAPAVVEPVTPPRQFKPRHRRRPVAQAATTPRGKTALAFLDVNGWSPAALQLLAAVDGNTEAIA